MAIAHLLQVGAKTFQRVAPKTKLMKIIDKFPVMSFKEFKNAGNARKGIATIKESFNPFVVENPYYKKAAEKLRLII